VVHHNGRKKTTNTETETVVGSIPLTTIQVKIAKKKPKEVDMNLYIFQK
jgi:ribosomal RNA-processing protein 7